MIRRRRAEAQLALMLLSRLPAGRMAGPPPPIGAAVWAFPLAGLVLGGLAAAALWAGLALGLPASLAAGLALAAQVALTGALHEDGLADLADGLWGGRDAARRLEIMRDSRIGSYGTLALILSLGLRGQALAWLVAQDAGPAAGAIIVLAMTSRLAPVLLLATLPPARRDGLGHAARDVPGTAILAATLIALAPALLLPGWLAMLAVQAALVAGLAALARRRLGGQTGDVLGAGQQLAETGGWLALCTAAAG